jgi:hypothetical protein
MRGYTDTKEYKESTRRTRETRNSIPVFIIITGCGKPVSKFGVPHDPTVKYLKDDITDVVVV